MINFDTKIVNEKIARYTSTTRLDVRQMSQFNCNSCMRTVGSNQSWIELTQAVIEGCGQSGYRDWSMYSWVGTRLEQFATFRLVVSITVSLHAEIEDRAFHTLVPCRLMLNKYFKHFRVEPAFIIVFVTWPLKFLGKIRLVNVARLGLNNNNNI